MILETKTALITGAGIRNRTSYCQRTGKNRVANEIFENAGLFP